MGKRLLYFYIKNSNYEDIIAFLKMDDLVKFQEVSSDCLVVQAEEEFSLSEFNKLREFIVEELLVDFVGFYVPFNFDFKISDLKFGFEKINAGIYDINSFIMEISLEKINILKMRLKSFYYSQVGVESINTCLGFVENNFNASLAAKKMYMHRNTLNYRIDNFINKTEIDIKNFKSGMALYLLFKR